MRPAYSSGTSEAPLLGETIGANLDHTVSRFADREAMVDCPSGRRWTYGQLARDVANLASGLLARGVAKGDRVGIWSPNCPEWVLTQYAAARWAPSSSTSIPPTARTSSSTSCGRQA